MDSKHALVPYSPQPPHPSHLNETRIVLAQDEVPRPILEQAVFTSHMAALRDKFKRPYFKDIDTSKVAVKIKGADGEHIFMNFIRPGNGSGTIKVFGPPCLTATAKMPPHGNLKRYLTDSEKANDRLVLTAKETFEAAEMSIGISGSPFGDQEVDLEGRGLLQGQLLDWIRSLEAIARTAWWNRHPELIKRRQTHYEKFKKEKCAKCKEAMKRPGSEQCFEHDPLTPEQEKTWREEILPAKMNDWWAPVIKRSDYGWTLFCQSKIWTPLVDTKGKKKTEDDPVLPVVDPELLKEPDHAEAYKQGYYMKNPIRAVNHRGKPIPYQEAILLQGGDLFIPMLDIGCDFKYGNEQGKFRLNVSCRGWQLLQRGVRPKVAEMTEGFDFTAEAPHLMLAPLPLKAIEDNRKRVEDVAQFIAAGKTAAEVLDKWRDEKKKPPIVRKNGYTQFALPVPHPQRQALAFTPAADGKKSIAPPALLPPPPPPPPSKERKREAKTKAQLEDEAAAMECLKAADEEEAEKKRAAVTAAAAGSGKRKTSEPATAAAGVNMPPPPKRPRAHPESAMATPSSSSAPATPRSMSPDDPDTPAAAAAASAAAEADAEAELG